MISIVSEVHKGLLEIKIYSKEKFFFNDINSLVNKFVNITVLKSVIDVLPKIILEFLIIIFLISIFIIKEYSGQLSEGFIFNFSLFSLGLIRLNPVLTTLIISINQLRFRQPAVIKLYDLITSIENEDSKNINLEKVRTNEKTFQSLELKNIKYKFENDKYIFDKINFKINRGDKIGIIGASGSGKSTFFKYFIRCIQKL